MFVRDDRSGHCFEIKTKDDIRATDEENAVKYAMTAALEVMDYAIGTTDDFDRDVIKAALDIILKACSLDYDFSVCCDASNNMPSVVANDQTVFTITCSHRINLCAFVLSFSAKPL